jgi:uncharacterized membrane protein YeaQ/YmgE (transglycosylase-associated protein family)
MLPHPGKEDMGFFKIALSGIAGSTLGGFAGQLSGRCQPGQSAGVIVSVICAIVLSWLYARSNPLPGRSV